MSTTAKLVQKYGAERARQIRRRLDDLEAAETLETMRSVAGHCEELAGDRDGQLSVRIGKNFRLIFEPANDPIPCKEDGGLDWKAVTDLRILEVVDYH